MQHSTSHRTTIVLTVIDFLFTIKSVLNIRSSLQEAEQIILSHPVDRSSRGSTDSRHSITAIKHKNLKLEHVKLALYLLEISPTLAQHDTIRVRSRIPLECLQNRIYPQAAFQLRGQVHARQENKSSNPACTPPEKQTATLRLAPIPPNASQSPVRLRRIGSSWTTKMKSMSLNGALTDEAK
jgi:hypothetical protein